jgi:hypothetical protein
VRQSYESAFCFSRTQPIRGASSKPSVGLAEPAPPLWGKPIQRHELDIKNGRSRRSAVMHCTIHPGINP